MWGLSFTLLVLVHCSQGPFATETLFSPWCLQTPRGTLLLLDSILFCGSMCLIIMPTHITRMNAAFVTCQQWQWSLLKDALLILFYFALSLTLRHLFSNFSLRISICVCEGVGGRERKRMCSLIPGESHSRCSGLSASVFAHWATSLALPQFLV